MSFLANVQVWITLLQNWLSDPEDEVQLEQWLETAEQLADAYDFSPKEERYIDLILDKYEEQWKKRMEYQMKRKAPCSIEELDTLLAQKQVEQRTPEWYAQMATVISASELGRLFGSARERAQFVLSKTVPKPILHQPLAVTGRMSAFDWGIRFEPVVKQIYEHKYAATVKDLGRMHHPTDPRCTASPDGLIYACADSQRMGRLIEIKCPVTREIDGTVPKDYYAQMQMQLHVTGRPACEYVEAVFSSPYNQVPMKEGPSLYNGYIAVIRYEEPKNGQDFYYAYSPLNPEEGWVPKEEVVEIIPWRLVQWGEQVVQKNEEWWSSLQPMLQTFWEDVEKAKQGNFTVPDSTRAPKKAKTEACIIQFHKCDENGEPQASQKAHVAPVLCDEAQHGPQASLTDPPVLLGGIGTGSAL
jgi:hypothetical protein